MHDLHQVRPESGALAPATQARIDEGVQPDMGDQTRTAGGHLASKLREGPHWKGVCLDLTYQGQPRHLGSVAQPAADPALHQPAVSEPVDPGLLPIAEGHGAGNGYGSGLPRLQIVLLQPLDQLLRDGVAAAGAADPQGAFLGDQSPNVRAIDDLHCFGYTSYLATPPVSLAWTIPQSGSRTPRGCASSWGWWTLPNVDARA